MSDITREEAFELLRKYNQDKKVGMHRQVVMVDILSYCS